jgi:hypothetical protein
MQKHQVGNIRTIMEQETSGVNHQDNNNAKTSGVKHQNNNDARNIRCQTSGS